MRLPTGADLISRFENVERLFPAQPGETLVALETLESEIERSDNPELIAKALILKGNALTQAGREADAEAHIEIAERRLAAMGHERGRVGMLNLRGVLASRRSDYVGSIQYVREALQLARPTQPPEVVANLAGNLGLNLAYLGEFAGALAMLEESLEHWRLAGNPAGIVPTLINLGFTSSSAGMPEAALAYYEEAHRRAEEAGDGLRQSLSLSNWAVELLKAGEEKGARAKARRAVELARGQPALFALAHSLESWASVEEKAGRVDAARNAFEEALSLYEGSGNRRGIATTELQLARLDESGRRSRLERALAAAREAGLKPEQARSLGLLATLARDDGEPARAFDLLQEARDLDRALYDEEAQRRLAAVKVQREIEALQLELSSERFRRTEMAELLEQVQVQRGMAEEESRQKTAILQIAAHDLRGMISGVIGCLDLAGHSLEAERTDGMVRELVADARAAARELFELLRRLIDVSAIERGAISIELAPTNVATALQPVLKRWMQAVEGKAQGLSAEMDPSLWVSADPDRLRQMTVNLLSNASKYSPLGSILEARLDRAGDRVRLSILDRGPGLSDEDQARMFRPFQTLSPRPTGGEQSTGLGLHIVKALAQKQGATLGYLRRPGGGSEFYFEFEAIDPPAGG